jgi:hypothetical protein
MGERRSYPLLLTVNGRRLNEVVIDPHYETKHEDISPNQRCVIPSFIHRNRNRGLCSALRA